MPDTAGTSGVFRNCRADRVFFRERAHAVPSRSPETLKRRLAGELNGEVTDVQPLNQIRGVSYRLQVSGLSLKAFRCNSHSSAGVVAQLLSELRSTAPPVVPDVVLVHEDWLVVRWVDGQPLAASRPDDNAVALLDLLEAIHAHPVPAGLPRPPAVPPYVQRLQQRVEQAPFRRTLGRALVGALHQVNRRMPTLGEEITLLHTDITPANVVKSADGHPMVVDNEALTFGSGRALDVWMAAASLYPLTDQPRIREFVAGYERRLPGSGALDDAEWYTAVLWLRKALKSYEKRRFFKAQRYAFRVAE